MERSSARAVFDCNVYLQAILNPRGPAGSCLQAAFDGRVLLFWSDHVLLEIRRTLSSASLRAKFVHLTDLRVEEFIRNVHKVATFIDDVPPVFEYSRDPDDAPYVNLALRTLSAFVVSRDRDLLDLRDQETPDGRAFAAQFPELRIITPPELVEFLDHAK